MLTAVWNDIFLMYRFWHWRPGGSKWTRSTTSWWSYRINSWNVGDDRQLPHW